MMARKLLRQIGGLECLLRGGDARYADVLDEHVRRHRHQALQRMTRTRVDERNRCAVAVPDQDRAFYAELAQQFGQGFERLAVHEIDAVRLLQHVGLAMAVARVDDCGQTGGFGDAVGKIAPLADRAQAFVQEHHGRAVGGRADAAVFEAAAENIDEGGRMGC